MSFEICLIKQPGFGDIQSNGEKAVEKAMNRTSKECGGREGAAVVLVGIDTAVSGYLRPEEYVLQVHLR